MVSRQYDLTYSLMQHMRLYGYEIVDLPVLEAANLFLIKAGDQLINRLFTFERNNKQWALRPEFTAPATFHYISTCQPGFVARWQFNGHVFEEDPLNNGEQYQRFSIGAELMGVNTPFADAEIIALAAQGIAAQGIADWKVNIGHTGLIRQILDHFNLDSRTQRFLLHQLPALKSFDLGKKFVLGQFDQQLTDSINTPEIIPEPLLQSAEVMPTLGTRTREEIAKRLAQKRQRATQRSQVIAALDLLESLQQIYGDPENVFAAIGTLITDHSQETHITLAHWQHVIDLLKLYDIPSSRITLQPDLARSWDYYTGIVFELHGAGMHLGGGGRYDELARLVGGEQDVPAVGFAYYVDNILTALPSLKDLEQKPAFSITAENQENAVFWAQQLRKQDISVQVASDSISENTLVAESKSSIRWQTRLYQLDQINKLLADINNLS